VPNVKIVLQHTRQIEEGEQRYRNIAKIFLENSEGERFLAPTIKPGIARVYGRLIAEGDKPHGERWNHVTSLVEEYQKMGAFVRATRNGQFNESAQRLVNEGINHYQGLRETLSRMTGHRGYNSYFESWTPSLMEEESEESNLNELFVQETLDPRIESVMPILNKLQKKVAEMKEVNELSEWADSLTEAPGAETLAHNVRTDDKNLKAFDLEEDDLDESFFDKIKQGAKKLDKLVTGGEPEDLIRDLQHKAGVTQTGKKPEFDVKAKELARSNPSDPGGNFMKGGKDLGIFKEEDMDEARVFGYDIKRVPDLKVSYDDAQELKNQLGMLRKVLMYATPDDMSSDARKQVSDIQYKIVNILHKNGLQESDLMSMEEALDPAQKAHQKINTPAVQRKKADSFSMHKSNTDDDGAVKVQGSNWKVTKQDLDKADEKNMTSPAGMAALKKKVSTGTNESVSEGQDDLDAIKRLVSR
jgi:hypothetical protein